jgi:hypothetical protein
MAIEIDFLGKAAELLEHSIRIFNIAREAEAHGRDLHVGTLQLAEAVAIGRGWREHMEEERKQLEKCTAKMETS